MKPRPSSPLLAYSTNVHRGETVADTYDFLRRFTIPVRDRVFPGEEGGLELRLGIGAARELKARRTRREFAEFLVANRLFVFSINAFPLLDFHARRVKEQVYRPSWGEADRPRWTNTIADIFAELLPEGIVGSISTSAGAYRPLGHDPKTFRKLAAGYLKTIEKLAALEASTGKTIVLAVEPEPETTLENAAEFIDFFESYLWPAAKSAWGSRGDRASLIEDRLRRFFTINFDTCHFSVLFQDMARSLRRLRRAGIQVGKLHVTSAVRLSNPYRSPAGYQDFRGMNEPRYFHQFCGVDADGDVAWRDLDLDRLPRKLIPDKHPAVAELRSHYHVPLYLKRWKRLGTTQDETREAVFETLRNRLTSQLVIETYTWPILRSESGLVSGIAKEFRWLLGTISEFEEQKAAKRKRRA